MRAYTIILVFGLLFYVSLPVNAQTDKKASCNPEACGPKGTKIAEAKAIKDLRTSFQDIVSGLSLSRYNFSEDVKSLVFEARETEEETLLILNQASQLIREELVKNIPSAQLSNELKSYKPKISNSKQEMVSKLNKEIKLFKDQVASLN